MMPGSALTGRFQFSTATVCVLPMAQQKAVNPLTHSIGLTKNVRVEATPSKVDLTQGIMNDVVATQTNGMPITSSMEVYEHTAKNMAYGLSLDPASIVDMGLPVPVSGGVAAGASSVSTAGDIAANVGDWIYIQENLDDQVHVAKVTGVNGGVISFTGHPVPTGMSFSTGARVGRLNKIDADPSRANNNFCVRIIGVAVDNSTPIVLHFPKCRITKGFAMGFSSDNFSNLPFEFTPMVPVATDPGYDPDFRQKMSVLSR